MAASLREQILALLTNEALLNGRSVKAICKDAKVHHNSVYRLFKKASPALATVDKLLDVLGWRITLVRKEADGPSN